MPFWPSLEPCAKLTPVQVSTRMPRITAEAPSLFRLVEQCRIFHQPLQQKQHHGRPHKPEHRGDQQRKADFLRLAPVDALPQRVAGHHGIRQPHPHDRADQGVRTGRRQAKIPRAEVPDNGRKKQGKHHRKPARGADIDHEIDRQQGHDPKGHRSRGSQHSDEVPHAGPDHGDHGPERVRVDNGRNRVCGIVKTVDEFETEGEAEGRDEKEPGESGWSRSFSEQVHPG